ncbi:MAG: diguanylate cyclase [Desulfobacteraceae bacterium]|nr:diguanylate cyclase [Desulfobacteraceae bacterium]
MFFEHINRKDGLPQVSANAIAQDEPGFLWFGTQGGLTRFDGYGFRTFRHHAGDASSLGDNSVWAVLCMKDGIIWVGTNGGLSRFDSRTETFTNYRSDPGDPNSLSDINVRTLLLDSRGTLWVGTRNGGLNACEPHADGSLVFKRYLHDKDEPGSIACNHIRDLHEDAAGGLWVATYGGGLCHMDLKNRQKGFTRFTHDPDNPDSISGNDILSIFETRHRGLFVGTEKGLNRLKPDGSGFDHFQDRLDDGTLLANMSMASMAEDARGDLWIGTGGGGLLWMDGTCRFRRFQPQSGFDRSLSGNDVRSLYVDRQGLLWIGTYGNGLNMMDPATRAFSLFRHGEDDPKSLSNSVVLSICEDSDQALWVGTWGGGVNRLTDRKSVDLKCKSTPGDETAISGNTVWAIHEDSGKNLWFGTWKGGLSLLTADQRSKANPVFVRYGTDPDRPGSLTSDSILSIHEDRRGILWVGTWGGGLNRLDPECLETGSVGFKHYRHDKGDPRSLGDDFIKTIMEDRHGNIWVGTWGGGISVLPAGAVNTGKGGFTRYRNRYDDPSSLSHNDVTCLFEDSRGIVWAATYGGGLNRFDPATGRFRSYTEKEGLSNNEVYGILPDGRGCLWVSTNNGINRFDPGTETFECYDARDGLQGDEFNQGACLRGRDGTLYFGGVKGLSAFNPSGLVDNSYIPPVCLTDFKVMHQSVPVTGSGILTRSILGTETVTLDHGDATFGMTFSALNYRQPDKNRYAYMLQGVDGDWIETGWRMRTAHYTNIDPGTYIFRVKASNDDGRWNENGPSLKVVIRPPWWALWWVRGLAAVLLAGLVFTLYAARVRFFRKQQLYLEGEVASRTWEVRRQKQEILEKNRALFEKNALLEVQAKKLKDTASRDPLTGLFNRRGFLERVESERIRAVRTQKMFAVFLGDIDFFKRINDQYGHDIGDLALVGVAEALRTSVRQVDCVGRWGGEEFIALLPETGIDHAVMVAERVRKQVEEMVVETGNGPIKVSITIGVACFAEDRTVDECIGLADAALYRGKEKGRNRVEI